MKNHKEYNIAPLFDGDRCPFCGRDFVPSKLKFSLYDALCENKIHHIERVNFCNACCIPFLTKNDVRTIESQNPGFHLESESVGKKSAESIRIKLGKTALPIKNIPKGTFLFYGDAAKHTCGSEFLKEYNFMLHGDVEAIEKGVECASCKRIIFGHEKHKMLKNNMDEYILMKDEIPWSEVFHDKKMLYVLNINQYTKDTCPACNNKLLDAKKYFKNDTKNEMQEKRFKECTGCGLSFVRSTSFVDKPYKMYKLSYDFFQEEEYRKDGKNIVIKAGDFLTRHNVQSCMSKNHSLEDITARITIADKLGKEFDYDVPAIRCDTCGKLFLLEKEYQKIIAKGVPLCSIVNNEYWRKKGEREHWSEFEVKGSVMFIHGYNVNANNDLSEFQRHSILKSLIKDSVLTKAEIISHLDMLIQRAEGQQLLAKAKAKWERDRAFIEKHSEAKETIRVNSITRKSFKTIS